MDEQIFENCAFLVFPCCPFQSSQPLIKIWSSLLSSFCKLSQFGEFIYLIKRCLNEGEKIDWRKCFSHSVLFSTLFNKFWMINFALIIIIMEFIFLFFYFFCFRFAIIFGCLIVEIGFIVQLKLWADNEINKLNNEKRFFSFLSGSSTGWSTRASLVSKINKIYLSLW